MRQEKFPCSSSCRLHTSCFSSSRPRATLSVLFSSLLFSSLLAGKSAGREKVAPRDGAYFLRSISQTKREKREKVCKKWRSSLELRYSTFQHFLAGRGTIFELHNHFCAHNRSRATTVGPARFSELNQLASWRKFGHFEARSELASFSLLGSCAQLVVRASLSFSLTQLALAFAFTLTLALSHSHRSRTHQLAPSQKQNKPKLTSSTAREANQTEPSRNNTKSKPAPEKSSKEEAQQEHLKEEHFRRASFQVQVALNSYSSSSSAERREKREEREEEEELERRPREVERARLS